MLRQRPGFTALVVFTLALGIGSNGAIFNLINSTLMRPLPVERPDDLSVLFTRRASDDGYGGVSYPDYLDYRDKNQVFSGLIAYSALPLSLSIGGGQNERVWGEIVTGNYFEMLGVRPALGRAIQPDDDKTPGAHPVAMLNYSYWQQRFGGDPRVVGQTVKINSVAYNIIGVAPHGFQGVFYVGFSPKLWIPMMQQAQAVPGGGGTLSQRDNRWLNVMGRLKPGATLEQAQAAMSTLTSNLDQEYQKTNKGVSVALFREREARPEPEAAGTLWMAAVVFMGMVGLVLLIACANVANLLLARSSARQREVAVRLALGASRWRLVRQLLTESVMLAILSGAVSLVLTVLTGRALSAIKLSTDIPFEFDFSLDYRVVFFTVLVSILAGIIFGLVPALRLSRTSLAIALNAEGTRGGTGGKHKARLRNALVVAQVAVSVIVLVTAGLFVRSMQRVLDIRPGFDVRNALLVSVDPRLQGYDEARGQQFYKNLVERLKAVPGVESATIASPFPLDFVSNSAEVVLEGGNRAPDESTTPILRSIVGPEYFQVTGTPIVQGRALNDRDTKDSPKVAIVNETMARRFWPGQDIAGKTIRLDGPEGPVYEVVGVAKDGKYRTLGEEPRPYFYLPFNQNYASEFVTVLVRTTGDPAGMVAPVRREVQMLDQDLPIFDVKTMESHMARSLLGARMSAAFTGVFGVLALALALMGLYSVIWYSVTLRSREIGIRMALGAQQSDILKLFLKQGLLMSLIGVGIGLVGAFIVGRLAPSLLYGVAPTDPVTFAAIALLFIACALLATYFPSRKAAKINPMIALRAE
jgi:predicted permease